MKMNYKQYYLFEEKRPDIWLGVVDDDLNVIGYIDNKGNHRNYGKKWRYRTDSNAVIWWEKPTEMDKDAVNDFLYKKTGVKNLKHISYDIAKYCSNPNDPLYQMSVAAHFNYKPIPDKYKLKEYFDIY